VAAARRVHAAFDRYIAGEQDTDLRKFRWIMRTLKHYSDPYGAAPLAASPYSMNSDPACAADYLAAVGLGKPAVVDSVMTKLDQPPEDMTDALDLHLLRAVGAKPRGRAEAKVFERIAEDTSRRSPVRAWAWKALRGTPRWKAERTMEAALAETDAVARRAMLCTLHGGSGRLQRIFLEQVEAQFPELQYTRRWLEAA
jgi:hypothetical protein